MGAPYFPWAIWGCGMLWDLTGMWLHGSPCLKETKWPRKRKPKRNPKSLDRQTLSGAPVLSLNGAQQAAWPKPTSKMGPSQPANSAASHEEQNRRQAHRLRWGVLGQHRPLLRLAQLRQEVLQLEASKTNSWPYWESKPLSFIGTLLFPRWWVTLLKSNCG